jgi:hypothetical protein
MRSPTVASVPEIAAVHPRAGRSGRRGPVKLKSRGCEPLVCNGDQVDDVLRQALDPVLHDLRAQAGSVTPPRIEDAGWTGDPRWGGRSAVEPDLAARAISLVIGGLSRSAERGGIRSCCCRGVAG